MNADIQRQKLANQDKNNRNIAIHKAYAQKIHQILQREYKDKEEKTRKQLQDTINSIFKQIYASDLQLSIDDRYNVSVSVMNHSDNDIETSTAQSISVIFAFISGIIKIAKENHTDAEASEPYPLVMDAPFSSFDKTRIGTICKVLPEITDQVVIFIKDTDGDLAEEYLREKIGNQYRFEVKDELETSIV